MTVGEFKQYLIDMQVSDNDEIAFDMDTKHVVIIRSTEEEESLTEQSRIWKQDISIPKRKGP